MNGKQLKPKFVDKVRNNTGLRNAKLMNISWQTEKNGGNDSRLFEFA